MKINKHIVFNQQLGRFCSRKRICTPVARFPLPVLSSCCKCGVVRFQPALLILIPRIIFSWFLALSLLVTVFRSAFTSEGASPIALQIKGSTVVFVTAERLADVLVSPNNRTLNRLGVLHHLLLEDHRPGNRAYSITANTLTANCLRVPLCIFRTALIYTASCCIPVHGLSPGRYPIQPHFSTGAQNSIVGSNCSQLTPKLLCQSFVESRHAWFVPWQEAV